MEGNTKISVIIPIYKAEKFLDKCIESVVGQTYENLEIILVDDGSPDNCPAICDSWAEKDSRIKVVHKENGGLSSARNAGLDVVTGEYFGFIDSDDWIEKDFFEFLIANALKENADISRCGLYLDYEDDDSCHDQEVQYETPVVMDNKGYINSIIGGGYVQGICCNKIYRTAAIGDKRFCTEDGVSEDIMFNNRISKNIKCAVFYDVPKYHYFRRKNSITISDFGYGSFSIIRAMNSFLAEYSYDEELFDTAVNGYATAAFTVLSGVITNRKCLDRYDELRNGLLGFKKQILFEKRYPFKYKFKLMLLWFSPKLYNKVIRKVRGA